MKSVYCGLFAQQGPGVAVFPVRVCDTMQESSEEAELPLDICPQQITVRWCETKEMKGKLLTCKQAAGYQAGQSEMPIPGIDTYLGRAQEDILLCFGVEQSLNRSVVNKQCWLSCVFTFSVTS